MKLVVVLLALLLSSKTHSQPTYACFENDKNTKLRLWVLFDKNEKAKYIKYEGQKDSIQLIHSHLEQSKNPGGIPAVYWSETYLEKFKGKITGEYTFTNAGTRQLDVTYTRKKDGKQYYFRIIESFFDEVTGVFKETPCF